MSRDTLFYDSNGHCPDVFEQIEQDGIAVAIEMLDMEPEELGADDETMHLLAIETICAAGGHPSLSDECDYIREWAKQNETHIEASVIAKMQSFINSMNLSGEDASLAECMLIRISKLASTDV